MLEIASNLSFSPPAFQALPQTSPVQVQVPNRMTGSAMSLLKQRDATNRLTASRYHSRHLFKLVGQADRPNPSEIEQDGPRARKLTFVEDFTLEHSLPGLHIASFELAGCF
jgi:hypothetical protein